MVGGDVPPIHIGTGIPGGTGGLPGGKPPIDLSGDVMDVVKGIGKGITRGISWLVGGNKRPPGRTSGAPIVKREDVTADEVEDMLRRVDPLIGDLDEIAKAALKLVEPKETTPKETTPKETTPKETTPKETKGTKTAPRDLFNSDKEYEDYINTLERLKARTNTNLDNLADGGAGPNDGDLENGINDLEGTGGKGKNKAGNDAGNGVNDAEGTAKGANDKLDDDVGGGGNGILETIGGGLAKVGEVLSGGGAGIAGAVAGIASAITSGLSALLSPILGASQGIADTLQASGLGGLAGDLGTVRGAIQTIENSIRSHTTDAEVVMDRIIGRIDQDQSETAAAIEDQTPVMQREASALEDIAGGVGADGILGTAARDALAAGERRSAAGLPSMRQVKPTDAPCIIDEGGTIDDIKNVPIIGPVVDALIRAGVGLQGLWAQASVLVRWCQMAYLRENPYEPPAASDVIAQWIRGRRNDESAVAGLRQWGYDSQEAMAMLHTARSPLPPERVIEALRREVMDDAQAMTELKRVGYSEIDAQRVIDMRDYILPPQDVIRLAVREVFTPDARREGQLDRDYPAELTARARQAGMSERDAKDLWAAHWELPSLRQGFQMLHRGVIDAETMDGLQRARDIAPGWRDRLRRIAYSPVTRVDLRRLHQDGVIDRDRLKRGYLDLGYSDSDADLMTDWTVRRSDAARQRADAREAGGVSRAAVIRLYRLGSISRSRARDMLTDTGLTADAAGQYLEATDLEARADARDDELRAILERARAGSVSEQGARNEIAGLGLESSERELALARLDRVVAARVKVPSRADLDRAAKAGLVDEGEYTRALVDQGWSVDWARRFWQSRPGQGA